MGHLRQRQNQTQSGPLQVTLGEFVAQVVEERVAGRPRGGRSTLQLARRELDKAGPAGVFRGLATLALSHAGRGRALEVARVGPWDSHTMNAKGSAKAKPERTVARGGVAVARG